jgi:catechol 2,3-dioxygenase-like lactoylglutathione lyase family enzyme
MRPVGADTGAHLCLRARTTDAIDAVHRLALCNGGTNDGAPGPRQATQVVYYAAFVRDPDGNRIEIMTVPPAMTP